MSNNFPVSPLAPDSFPVLETISGVKLATAACGIRYTGRDDLLLAVFPPETKVAGVFTRSLTASAPVIACREAIKGGVARVLIVNSGNSNAFTGKEGVDSLRRVQKTACELAGCADNEFFMASTGVIGEILPDHKITSALADIFAKSGSSGWEKAARAIMTTDSFPKMSTRSIVIDGKKITINGIAKGSGMIAPDMATMLAFIFTDADISAAALQKSLSATNEQSFNCISVDGDTSTSDTALIFATGKAQNNLIDETKQAEFSAFQQALQEVMSELALLVVKDGEGAEKLITIKVTGAANYQAARRIGMSIANSPLVKTAIAASDANWGRIVMAVGKSGEAADRDLLAIKIGGVSVARNGMVDPQYKETAIADHMQGRDIKIEVDVGIASGEATVYSCDLTHRYIDINGSYRT